MGNKTYKWIIYYANGAKNIVDTASTEDGALEISIASIGRAAGLCRDHLVKVSKVERI